MERTGTDSNADANTDTSTNTGSRLCIVVEDEDGGVVTMPVLSTDCSLSDVMWRYVAGLGVLPAGFPLPSADASTDSSTTPGAPSAPTSAPTPTPTLQLKPTPAPGAATTPAPTDTGRPRHRRRPSTEAFTDACTDVFSTEACTDAADPSRRKLPEHNGLNRKLETIIHQDFGAPPHARAPSPG